MKILNRPMFRKGGSSKGTGVMSMVEPRENYQFGSTIKNIRDLQTQYQTELMKASQPSNVEKAALIAQIAGTPGGLYEKITATLPTQTKIAAQQRALKPELIKQKMAGEIEIAKLEAAAGKGTTFKRDLNTTIEFMKDLRKQGDPTFKNLSDVQIEKRAYDDVSKKYRTSRSPTTALQDMTRTYGEKISEKVGDVKAAIRDGDKEEYDIAVAELMTIKRLFDNTPGLSGYGKLFEVPPFPVKGKKDGGRIKLKDGTDLEMVDTENTTPELKEKAEMIGDTIESNQPVQSGTELKSFTYDELRGRLPKEVDDGIVNLLANSQEALEDFAYITTQTDIGNFNQKYGVNLTLPVSE